LAKTQEKIKESLKNAKIQTYVRIRCCFSIQK